MNVISCFLKILFSFKPTHSRTECLIQSKADVFNQLTSMFMLRWRETKLQTDGTLCHLQHRVNKVPLLDFIVCCQLTQ